jgi:hypothetical protein
MQLTYTKFMVFIPPPNKETNSYNLKQNYKQVNLK